MNENLSFIFTPDGFCPDASDGGEYSAWMNDGGFSALYEAGLKAAPKTMSPSARFLYQTAAAYFKQLTDLPELELARDQVRVPVSEELCEELLQSVPFAIGAEYVTADWIRNVFGKLTDIFRKEIAGYGGTRISMCRSVFSSILWKIKMTVNFPLLFWRRMPPKVKIIRFVMCLCSTP